MNCNVKRNWNSSKNISAGGGGWGLQPPKLERNPFHLGKCTETAIGNSGNISASSPTLFDISVENLQTPPPNLTSSYAHE